MDIRFKAGPTRKPHIAIIGAGPAGLASAVELLNNDFDVTVLELSDRIGGKCYTYYEKSPTGELVKTELGAALVASTPDYALVDKLRAKKGVIYESPAPTSNDFVPFFQETAKKSKAEQDFFMLEFIGELTKFTARVDEYQHHPEAKEFSLPFAQYAKEHNLQKVNEFLKMFVTGFGYGDMNEITTAKVMEYMKKATIPAILISQILKKPTDALRSIRGGFQYLMEQIAEDFKDRIVKSAQVTSINSSASGVNIRYNKNGEIKFLKADAFVLAISPLFWPSLGITNLTALEKQSTEQVKYHRYPVAACKIKVFETENLYLPGGLDEKGFGHPALITTSDARKNPEDGRLCTMYVNLPPGPIDFKFDTETCARLEKEVADVLKGRAKKQTPSTETKPEEINVKIVKTQIWEDYNSSLDEKLKNAIKEEQKKLFNSLRRIHVGSSFSFEDVGCVMTHATQVTNELLVKKKMQLCPVQEIINTIRFQESKAVPLGAPPVKSPEDSSINQRKCCVIL